MKNPTLLSWRDVSVFFRTVVLWMSAGVFACLLKRIGLFEGMSRWDVSIAMVLIGILTEVIKLRDRLKEIK